MQNGSRKRQDWKWAKQHASLFNGILPEHVREAAMATCRITLQGPKSVGKTAKNWGRWIRMRMQTFGHAPTGIGTVQIMSNWIGTDSHDAVNAILECFELSLDDVFDRYGEPEQGQTRQLNLCELVTAIAPDFAATERESVAVA